MSIGKRDGGSSTSKETLLAPEPVPVVTTVATTAAAAATAAPVPVAAPIGYVTVLDAR